MPFMLAISNALWAICSEFFAADDFSFADLLLMLNL